MCSRRKALQYETWEGSPNTGDSGSRGVAATQDGCGPPQGGHSISPVPGAWGVCVCASRKLALSSSKEVSPASQEEFQFLVAI